MEAPQAKQHPSTEDKTTVASSIPKDDAEATPQSSKQSSLIGDQDNSKQEESVVPSSDSHKSTHPSKDDSHISHSDASNNTTSAAESAVKESASSENASATIHDQPLSRPAPPPAESQTQPHDDPSEQEKSSQTISNSTTQSGPSSETAELRPSETRSLDAVHAQSKSVDDADEDEQDAHLDVTDKTPRVSKLPELPTLELSTGGFGESFSADWDEAGSELQEIFSSRKDFSIAISKTKAHTVPVSELGALESDAASEGEEEELAGEDLERAVMKGYLELASLSQRTGDLDSAVTHYGDALALLDKTFQRDGLYNNQSLDPLNAMDPLQVERMTTLQAVHSFILSTTTQASALNLLPLSRTLCNIQTNLKGHRHRDTLASARSLVTLLYFNGLYNEANLLGGESLRIAREEFGEKNNETLHLKHTMGRVARELGFLPQARELLEEVIAMRESENTINEELLEAVLDLAGILEELDLLDEMLEFQEKKSSLFKSKLSPIHPYTIRCEAALAVTLAKIEGKETQAKTLALEVVQRAEGIFGERHRRTLDALANKATVHMELGELDEAEAMFSDVLDQHIQTLGDPDLSTLHVKESYAVLLQNTGTFDRALNIQDSLVSEYVAVLGDRHPRTVKAFMDRASSLGATGRFGEARGLLEKNIIPAYESIYGKEGSKTIKALQALSATLVQLAELIRAREVQEEVVAALKIRHGEKDPVTIAASLTLSTIVWSSGKETEGLAMEIAAMDLQKEVLGPKDPVVLQTMHNHAVTLQSIGRYGPSLRVIDQVVKSRQEVLGNGDKDTVASLWTMVCAYEGLGQIPEALETMKRTIKYAEIGRGEAADGSRNISEDRQVSDEELEEYRDSLREMTGEVQLFEKKFGAIS